ncbi:3'(2'),5'-bisphosphate nucleotidase [Gracilibacillus boraciitolerans JCM 21714]|uniref:3'(2'),5'-bisphosphate nucleotidase n=1 Tax=Gracilibacillus boraciitolerans JCM 21714 TaxID=1298598 RepID=W4VQU4_9BACI|nr:3'(2'),5'-bisphosphate nucleotidase [Gracilibacillus boraciitolerans JCM 21714]
MNKYLYDLFDICLNAGKEIMDIYNQDFDVEFKVDDSPVDRSR